MWTIAAEQQPAAASSAAAQIHERFLRPPSSRKDKRWQIFALSEIFTLEEVEEKFHY